MDESSIFTLIIDTMILCQNNTVDDKKDCSNADDTKEYVTNHIVH